MKARREARAQAAKTLRKVKSFGKKNIDTYGSFAWPTEADIMEMPLEKPIKVVSFDYKCRYHSINQVQVNLSNGASSPLFASKITDNLSEQKTLKFSDAAMVRRVQGSLPIYYIFELHFKN